MSRKAPLLVLCAALVAALLALPGVAAARSGDGMVRTLAAGACKAKKADLGKRAFRKHYGKRPMRACVKKARAQARDAVSEGSDECRAELEEYGPDEFYGEWDSFEDCVADHAAGAMEGDDADEDEVDEGEDQVCEKSVDEGEDCPGDEEGEDPGEHEGDTPGEHEGEHKGDHGDGPCDHAPEPPTGDGDNV